VKENWCRRQEKKRKSSALARLSPRHCLLPVGIIISSSYIALCGFLTVSYGEGLQT
jgi:hypothetical protein